VIIYSSSSQFEFCVSSFLFSSAYNDLFFFFSLFITSIALNNFSLYYASSYSSLVPSLSESFTAMNKTISFSISLTSSSFDEELSYLVQKLFLKTFFLVLLPLYICLLFESSSSFLLFSYEDIC
jgi:hypothetical protein